LTLDVIYVLVSLIIVIRFLNFILSIPRLTWSMESFVPFTISSRHAGSVCFLLKNIIIFFSIGCKPRLDIRILKESVEVDFLNV
jgi:hypothetical protein